MMVNLRSLRFRLISWYAALLLGAFALAGSATLLMLDRSLTSALAQSQSRRAREIAHLLGEELRTQDETLARRVHRQIEESFAPARNDRLIRITRPDGTTLYHSAPPLDRSFDPAALPPPRWNTAGAGPIRITLPDRGRLLLVTEYVPCPDGSPCLVEVGAPLNEVRAEVRQAALFLSVLLPVLGFTAIGGAWWLVTRALAPVDRIAAAAERIHYDSLNERLPLPGTHDEVERLTLALNHMIDRLDSAFRHSRRFVADASHELRTPLTILRGELEGCLTDNPPAAESRERLASALEEAVRLSNIVGGLFAISRLDAGEAAAEWVPFDLALLTRSTADQMSLLAEDKQIRVTCDTVIGLWVEGDRSRMRQVVVNLLDNAIKYTPAGGTVTLTVQAVDNHARLEVADSGIGIPEASLPLVFDRFYRVDETRSRELGGAGLGLSIVKSICTAHHGSVEVTSRPGAGSVFRVTLPLARDPAARPSSPS